MQPHEQIPRNHRFVLGERIERNLYSLLETLIQAKYTKSRQRLLEQANLTLEFLRFPNPSRLRTELFRIYTLPLPPFETP